MNPTNSQPACASEPPQTDLLLNSMRRALAANVTEAMKVAGDQDADGTPGKLTQVDLHTMTGIARSTLSRLVTDNKVKPSNPDLQTLATLAALLDVPPYFLVMRPEDWQLLAMASQYYQLIMDDDELAEEVNRKTQLDKVRAGLEVAERLGIYHPQEPLVDASDREDEIRADLERQRRRTERAILTATAITQLSSRESNRLLLTAVGALIGANQK